MSPQKPLESFFGRILYRKTRFLAQMTIKPLLNAIGRVRDSEVFASSMLLLVSLGTQYQKENLKEFVTSS